MLTERTGDLFTAKTDAIGHGVNCKGLMGKGIALAFRDRFPLMYDEYKLMCIEGLLRPGQVFPYHTSELDADDQAVTVVIVNIATQEYPGPDASYEWVDAGIRNALAYCRDRGLRSLAIPRIGCGIGGLAWDLVRDLLEVAASGYPDVELEVWTL